MERDRTLRVLVIEDEMLIGILLEDMITDLGAAFVGPVTSLAEASAAVLLDNFDVALVDMNLHGQRADDVGRTLARRRIPFAIASGSPETDLELGHTLVLQKPFTFDDIEAALQRLSDVRR